MPIISSLGALAYPKASFISFGTGRGYMFAASGASQSFNRNGNNGDTFDTNFSSVGADSSGNMYVQSCRAPTNSLLSNGTAYPIQVDDTDASPQFDFSKPGGNKDLESFVNINYNKIKIHKVLGKRGTLFYFDNNIAHRAGPKVNKERTVLILQLYPSLNSIY